MGDDKGRSVELTEGLLKALIALCSTLVVAVVTLVGSVLSASARAMRAANAAATVAKAAADTAADLPSVIAHGDGNGTPGVQAPLARLEAKLDRVVDRVEALATSLDGCRQSEDIRSAGIERRLLAVENRHFAAGRGSVAGGGQ